RGEKRRASLHAALSGLIRRHSPLRMGPHQERGLPARNSNSVAPIAPDSRLLLGGQEPARFPRGP
ncbi:MAG: hypothetical protein ACK4RW_12385, partial [Rehaibacterium terrae]|uniref:hypothetical protein n=1 Tax=Rehaibacterium terrae TaxID=1341696 RepID=UPI003919D039